MSQETALIILSAVVALLVFTLVLLFLAAIINFLCRWITKKRIMKKAKLEDTPLKKAQLIAGKIYILLANKSPAYLKMKIEVFVTKVLPHLVKRKQELKRAIDIGKKYIAFHEYQKLEGEQKEFYDDIQKNTAELEERYIDVTTQIESCLLFLGDLHSKLLLEKDKKEGFSEISTWCDDFINEIWANSGTPGTAPSQLKK